MAGARDLSSPCQFSPLPRVDDRNAGVLEVAAVSGDDRLVVNGCGRGDESVGNGSRPLGSKSALCDRDVVVDRQDAVGVSTP
jgi:hypothetical protein